LAIAERVKRVRPDLWMLFGGPGVHGVDAALIERFSFVDAVLRGEGEEALAELLADWTPGTQPRFKGRAGFTWRAADGAAVREPDRAPMQDLDKLAAPAWELLPALAEYKAITGADDGLVPVDSGRGCAFDCSFCTIGRYWRRRSRTLSPARLADEIEALGGLAGARQAYLCHDIFGADRAHALAFCAEMETRQTLPFEVRARLDHLDDELVDAMAHAGCYRVLVGIESAASAVRERANKDLCGLDTPELLRRIAHLAEAGITPILSLILGLPGETRDDLEASLDFLSDAAARTGRGGAQLSLHLVNPQPGCALGEELGEGSSEVPGIPPDMALGAGLSAAERALIEAHPDLFSTWHLLTNQAGGAEHLVFLHAIAKHLPALLMRYPRTHAALRERTAKSTLALFEERRAARFSFEAQARRLADPAVDALLAWEQAKLRTSARGGPWRHCQLHWSEGTTDLELHLEPLELTDDVAALTRALAAGQPLPSHPTPTHFLVGSASDGVAIATHRVSPDLFRIYLDLGESCRGAGPAPDRELVQHLATFNDGILLRLTQLQP